MKKILLSILFLSSFSLISCDAKEVEFEVKLLDNNTCEIVSINNAENLKEINVPDDIDGISVTSIGLDAFKNFEKLKTITLPSSLITIGPNAFYGCSSLTEITIPSSVEKIDCYAFGYCVNLKSVTLNEGLKIIGDEAFASCVELENISLPNSLEKIGSTAFSLCHNLYSFDYGSSKMQLAVLDGWIVDSMKVDNIFTINEGIVGIADSSIHGEINELYLPDSLKHIGDNAFALNKDLRRVDFGKGLLSIGKDAFYNCSELYEVHIPKHMPWYNVSISNREASPFTVADKVYYGDDIWTVLEIPEGVTSISKYAFADLYTIDKVILPGSISKINEGAFYYNTNLSSVSIPSLKDWYEIFFEDGYANPINSSKLYVNDELVTTAHFDNDVKPYVFYNYKYLNKVTFGDNITHVADHAFEGCSNLSSVKINKVKHIGNYSFSNTGFTSLDLEYDIETVGEGAFSGCQNVENIIIGAKIYYIGKYAFDLITNLSTFEYKNKDGWFVTEDENATKGQTIDIDNEGYYLFLSPTFDYSNPYYGMCWKRSV